MFIQIVGFVVIAYSNIFFASWLIPPSDGILHVNFRQLVCTFHPEVHMEQFTFLPNEMIPSFSMKATGWQLEIPFPSWRLNAVLLLAPLIMDHVLNDMNRDCISIGCEVHTPVQVHGRRDIPISAL